MSSRDTKARHTTALRDAHLRTLLRDSRQDIVSDVPCGVPHVRARGHETQKSFWTSRSDPSAKCGSSDASHKNSTQDSVPKVTGALAINSLRRRRPVRAVHKSGSSKAAAVQLRLDSATMCTPLPSHDATRTSRIPCARAPDAHAPSPFACLRTQAPRPASCVVSQTHAHSAHAEAWIGLARRCDQARPRCSTPLRQRDALLARTVCRLPSCADGRAHAVERRGAEAASRMGTSCRVGRGRCRSVSDDPRVRGLPQYRP